MPGRDTRIIGVDDGRSVGRQRAHGVGMLGRDFVDGAHELLVLALRIGDDGDRRLCDTRELARFTAVIHPELEHGEAMVTAHREHGEGQPDGVVEVARRGSDGVIADGRAEDRRDHLLGGRLAVTPGDDGDRDREASAPERRQRGERLQRIVDGNEVSFERRRAASLDERRGGTACKRLLDEIMSVEALTFQRDEQIAGREAAGIGRDAGETHGGADHGATDRSCGHRRVHHP